MADTKVTIDAQEIKGQWWLSLASVIDLLWAADVDPAMIALLEKRAREAR